MRRSEEYWDLIAGPTEVRCEAHVQDGTRCLRSAIAGANVCRQHGGAIPAVRAKAAARMGNAADEMVKRLLAWLDDPGVDVSVKAKIAQDMLDRAGLNVVEKHVVGIGEIDPVERLFRDLHALPDHGLEPAQPVPYMPSPAQLELNRLADPQALEDDDHPVVQGEVVEKPASSPSPARPKRKGTDPPKHIREALERLI
jgi:hypothetical protein